MATHPLYIASSEDRSIIDPFIHQFSLKVIDQFPHDESFFLCFEKGALQLRQRYGKHYRSLMVDWSRHFSSYEKIGQRALIAKAVGIKSNSHPDILDLTAGLGQDAFTLASLGCSVILVERSPMMAALLADGLRRAQLNDKLREISARLTLVYQESSIYLKNLKTTQKPSVIYLDPMFPPRSKSALVKKEMQLLQALLKENEREEENERLLRFALQKAAQRVIVKRPRLSTYLASLAPDVQYIGKSFRFDVYLRHLSPRDQVAG